MRGRLDHERQTYRHATDDVERRRAARGPLFDRPRQDERRNSHESRREAGETRLGPRDASEGRDTRLAPRRRRSVLRAETDDGCLESHAVDEGSEEAIATSKATRPRKNPDATNVSGPDVVDERAKTLTPRAGSKLARVIDLLQRSDGATILDLVEATGWMPHSTRAALTGLRKLKLKPGARALPGSARDQHGGGRARRGRCRPRQRVRAARPGMILPGGVGGEVGPQCHKRASQGVIRPITILC